VAKARTTPAESAADADATPEQAQQAQEERAQAEAAGEYEGAAQPSQADVGGETGYSVERLIVDSEDFLGVPSMVAAGALSSVTDPYVTIEQAKAKIEEFNQQPDTTGEES
jgi:hypothetical protein